jgi:hypothetical protein
MYANSQPTGCWSLRGLASVLVDVASGLGVPEMALTGDWAIIVLAWQRVCTAVLLIVFVLAYGRSPSGLGLIPGLLSRRFLGLQPVQSHQLSRSLGLSFIDIEKSTRFLASEEKATHVSIGLHVLLDIVIGKKRLELQ